MPGPPASTATGRPPASTQPRWAQPSIPKASPLTTARPATPNARPNECAISEPYGEGLRVPTIVTAGPRWTSSRASRPPTPKRTAGGGAGGPARAPLGASPPADAEEYGGRVGELAEPRRICRGVSADGPASGGVDRLAGALGVEGLEPSVQVRIGLADHRRDQLLVAQ